MFSEEKLYELAYLGSRNKNSEFEFEGRFFNVVEKKWFAYDNEYYGASIYSIKNINNKRASIYVVIDNGVGNEGYDIKITRSYKEALTAYNDFENLIKSDFSNDEEHKRTQLWLSSLENCHICLSEDTNTSIAYDTNINEFIFITHSYKDGMYSYGVYGDLVQNQIYDNAGSKIPYEYGFENIDGVIEYLTNRNLCFDDTENNIREFEISIKRL